MKLVVLGAGGMVGRNVCESARFGSHQLLRPARSELDLSDFQATLAYFRFHKPDLVIHAAGKVGGIQANIAAPVSFLLENLDMGRNVVMAAREACVRRLLNLGSSCMYPRDRDYAMPEEEILRGELEPTNEGYALAKVVVARLCQYISREDSSFSYKTLVPCNLFGRYDSFDPVRSHLIPAIIHKTHLAREQGLPAIEIWGDGTARREFMYAGELADAVGFAVENFDGLPSILNIGLGYDYSVNEYYGIAASIIGFRGGFVHDLARPVGMARKLMDVSRLSQLGWTPRGSVEDGMRETYAYYLEHVAK